jgi:hypothetical protein
MKNLDKFFSKADLPWVKMLWSQYYANGKIRSSMKGSFWWRSILRLLNSFKAWQRQILAMVTQFYFSKIYGMVLC